MTDLYVPTIPRHPDAPTVSLGGGSLDSGSGTPDPNAPAHPGDIYLNITTGDLYAFIDATWRILVGGSGGNSVTVDTVDANGSGTKIGDFWFNKSTNSLWTWTGSEWQQIIAA